MAILRQIIWYTIFFKLIDNIYIYITDCIFKSGRKWKKYTKYTKTCFRTLVRIPVTFPIFLYFLLSGIRSIRSIRNYVRA